MAVINEWCPLRCAGLMGLLPGMEGPQGLPCRPPAPPPPVWLHLSRLQKAVRGEPGRPQRRWSAFIRDDRLNAYGPPITRTSGGSATPVTVDADEECWRASTRPQGRDAAFR